MNYSKSELVTWSNTFSCGIKLIDDQHKELVNLVNDMFMHVTGSETDEREYLSKVIQKTVDYIKKHFSTEEKIMRAAGFSGYKKHKQTHDSFIITVIETINEYNSGKKFSLYTFTKFLKDWVYSHIAVMDKQYFEYVRQIASRKNDGKLSVTAYDVERYHEANTFRAADKFHAADKFSEAEHAA